MQSQTRPSKGVDRILVGVYVGMSVFLIFLLVAIKNLSGLSWTTVLSSFGVLVVVISGVIIWRIMHKAKPTTLQTQLAEPTPQVADEQHEYRPDNTQPIGLRDLINAGLRPGSPQDLSHPTTPETPEEFVSQVFRRHWKMAVRNAFPPVAIMGLMFIGLSYMLIRYNSIPLEYRVIDPIYAIAAMFGLVLGMAYVVPREIFRMRGSNIIVEKHRVIICKPKNLFYLFFGGKLSLKRRGIEAAPLEDATMMEMIFFKNVRTVSLDTPAQLDEKGKHLRDVIDAEELSRLVIVPYGE